MKFEDFLMQRSEERQKRLELEDEVVSLQAELEKQQRVNRVLQCAMHQTTIPRPRLSPLLPVQVQVLLAEIAMVEEEIICLERKVEELNLCVYQETKQTQEWEFLRQHQQQKHYRCKQGRQRELTDFRSQRRMRERRASLGSVSEIHSLPSTSFHRNEINSEKPNRLSEELIKCLIGIFLRLNRPLAELDCKESVLVPKLTVSCMNTKGLVSKTPFNCKSPMFSLDDKKSILDPYGVMPDLDRTFRDVGPYKNFIQVTGSSLDINSVSEFYPEITKLRVLIHKLCTVDLSFLTYKQKLAFWINIYNACIMHAFLQHGLPSSADKLLALMNKAELNVGGIVLNALAIEHFILRHPSDSYNGAMDENERLLRHEYGLRYPEPDVTFALCRGSWSSPALRIYTEDVVNELGRAKTEYLEASIGVTSKKKIVVPKLLHWYMQDFADDMESLLEWIYSQLPQLGPLKRLIMECLNGETKSPIAKMVEIHPYKSEFRYLLP
ncbi:protein of unknown function DUF547 [Macleaya cordata]|uniref:DUF547 domain-containing protein n=1 Tax=Macleaya cordata TaxID=56857 RepID=A0A200Q670_MACCD|nr:protein of unknown function DUF547 [Macleaya cordata]